ncbi:hypothetical protein SteCoe_12529 [Stentor coeruleus]|uniref:Uncharacterized protein n=1 Tax=Stentor coeruleus TaxID=5963 RepID=A0A1R2CAK0_9CILI|nr:hypothetical protein SteCoe_12529 [Stentor coeruleus]
MTDTCISQGCQKSPKYACLCDFTLKMCEIHLNEHLKLGESHKPILTFAEKKKVDELFNKEMTNLFSISSKTLVKGKQMFQQICNKLCEITDVLSQKQQSLIDLRSQSSYDVDIEENIKNLSQVGLKFRNKESFRKLLEKHLSESDDSIDLSLFLEKFDEISKRIEVNNGFLQFVSDRNVSERQELDIKLQNMMKDRVFKENAFEKKMETMSTKLEKFYENHQVQTLKEQTHNLELEIEKLKEKLHQNSLAADIKKKGKFIQEKKLETQGKMLTELCKMNLEMVINKYNQQKEQIEASVNSLNAVISENNNLLNSQIEKTEKNEKILEEKIKNLNSLLISEIESIKKDFKTKFDKNSLALENSNSKLTDKINHHKSELDSLLGKYNEHMINFTKTSTNANLELNKITDKFNNLEIVISSKAGINDIMHCKGFIEIFGECFREFNRFIKCVKFSNSEGYIFICINKFRSYIINSS